MTLALVGAGFAVFGQSDYEVEILMPNADGTYPGGQVVLAGERVGQIREVRVVEDRALVRVEVDADHAPLRAGTTARINWLSAIGARVLELLPGGASNPLLPSGSRIVSGNERVEIDDLLATLDKPTRDQVQGLVDQLNKTLAQREPDVQETLRSTGPAVEALGDVMRAVGDDGPAIRELVTRLHDVTAQLAARGPDLGQTVDNLHQLTSAVANEQQALQNGLSQLPSTVGQANTTLRNVPGAVDATVPLLNTLRPATAQLPSVARNLSPVLEQLQPTVAALRPALGDVQSLLQQTPALLDSAHGTLPAVTAAITELQPAVAFLRPYAPEIAGWLSNWTEIFANQNSGNYGRVLIAASSTSVNDNPGLLPPGIRQDQRPAPGSLVNQPWVDANGDGIR
ncbi:MCE family protein [Amycolatopsis methanolica]|nr:MCE family protein [Amycolatopsis methanolica]